MNDYIGHIGLDASPLTRAHYTGTEWYLWHLVRELARLPETGRYYWHLYTPHRGATIRQMELPHNWQYQSLLWPIKRFWLEGRLSLEMLKARPDVLFVPANILPLAGGKNNITTIHDVGFLTHPSAYSFYERKRLRRAIKRAIGRCSYIITISNFTKNELIKYFNISPKRIIVTHLGVAKEQYEKAVTYETEKAVLPNSPYILFIGRLSYKKNLICLITSFEKFCLKEKLNNFFLCLIGAHGFGAEAIMRKINKSELKNQIMLMSWQEEETLPRIIRQAKMLILPSLYEGFGLTVLEAQAVSTPVICSDIPSLRETAGDGALFFSLDKQDDLTEKMSLLMHNDKLREKLIVNGRRNIEKFSWHNTAKRTFEAFQLALGGDK